MPGPYSGLGDAWHKFSGELIPRVGRPLTGAYLEVYVNDCTTVPEAELRTDLMAPV